MRKSLLSKIMMGAAALFILSIPAAAAEATQEAPQVYTTPDNVLSIQAPSSSWKPVSNSGSWFEMSDGDCTITISHLSNGEALPAQTVASDSKAAVLQSLISTKNEVFVVTGTSNNQAHLQELIQAAGSVKILIYDTKTAVKAAPAAANETEKTAAKQITVYALDGSERTLTFVENDTWKDSNGNVFYNTVDNMYYEEHTGLFWSSDPQYWSKREAEGVTTWITVYAENGATDEIGLGLDNVWRNHDDQVYEILSVDTYTGPDGMVYSIYPDYWDTDSESEEDADEQKDEAEDDGDAAEAEESEAEQGSSEAASSEEEAEDTADDDQDNAEDYAEDGEESGEYEEDYVEE